MPEDRTAYDPFAPPAPQLSTVGDDEPGSSDVPVAAELPDDLDDISRTDLIAIAEQLNVPTYGSKAAIAARVREVMAS